MSSRKPRGDLSPNTYNYEQLPLVKPTGFREYDARWLFGSELNLAGVQAVGLGIGTLLARRNVRRDIVVGHDYRSYSSAIKYALTTGLMASGVHVHDIGLCTTPMAYFAQFALDVPAVAMVTASHNENGWTGIKMGLDRPLTFGPDDMAELKSIVHNGEGRMASGGGLSLVEGMFARYLADLTPKTPLRGPLRVGAICGNGTAGAFAPHVLRAAGCEVIEIDCGLDFTFPNYNPNPEDLTMLKVMQDTVHQHKLDVAFGFDGDGDRCGVADNEGHVIFADKIGLMMARDMAMQRPGSRFVVDVKSTGLFAVDPVLQQQGSEVTFWKTGHSYIKRHTRDIDAVAGFEKSGHFFFRPPYGHGYDDGLVSALAICGMLDRAPGKTLADLYRDLPVSWTSPTMSPHCGDDVKYGVTERLTQHVTQLYAAGAEICGQRVRDINTVNGIRFTLTNGSWGLIRASSNKPELVVVCESMVSAVEMKDIFSFIRGLLAREPEVGAFNQVI